MLLAKAHVLCKLSYTYAAYFLHYAISPVLLYLYFFDNLHTIVKSKKKKLENLIAIHMLAFYMKHFHKKLIRNDNDTIDSIEMKMGIYCDLLKIKLIRFSLFFLLLILKFHFFSFHLHRLVYDSHRYLYFIFFLL